MPLLRMQPGDIVLPVREGETILAAACRDGFTYRFGCRRGGCGICKADLVSGAVGYDTTVADSVLGEQEKAAGVVLTCRARILSDEAVLRMRPDSKLKLVFPWLLAATQQEIEQIRRANAGHAINDRSGGARSNIVQRRRP
ncbi:2Fe-2S iron-sulfur cluster-binding protein [Nocardia africana]|uniref:CDP-6-deoxy-L-threo-D-glycero-4-hexulose-3-dehydr ase reductase n=1 Tax=Nocardia africana TaxID=134964 RepID=A0A378WVR3_9NOCA|nr:2Fe-2S iron-sulfur cluster-binding protein [Nocardia africana]MCC3313781.1 2Fe-2S iron-sulfur cluster-binding protein [Nocardia africana]SUA44837.1 CDP-6-deoxy-L-threo-D-glycero-4-hexulose-3-dehydrase reductase [Nocardia africana]